MFRYVLSLVLLSVALPARAEVPQQSTPIPTVQPSGPVRDSKGIANLLAPLHVRWYGLLEMGMPGGGGFRVGADWFTPELPVFAAVQFARDWGTDPIHIGGNFNDSVISRYFNGTRTWEVKAGLLWRSFTHSMEEMNYESNVSYQGNYRLSNVSVYNVPAPAQRMLSLYAGFRSRTVPGAKTCDKDYRKAQEDCEATSAPFLMLGLHRLLAMDLDVRTKEHGSLVWGNTRSLDVHLLYVTDGDLPLRGSFLSRLGAEVQVIHAKPGLGFAVHYGFGYDGDYVLLHGGIGFGGSLSLAGAPKPAPEFP